MGFLGKNSCPYNLLLLQQDLVIFEENDVFETFEEWRTIIFISEKRKIYIYIYILNSKNTVLTFPFPTISFLVSTE
jgi:hypothetical protein